jgi:hypothetical protein
MDSAERYRREQDLIFQDLEEREMIRKQAAERDQAAHEALVASLMDTLIKYRRSNGRPISADEARTRVIKALQEE